MRVLPLLPVAALGSVVLAVAVAFPTTTSSAGSKVAASAWTAYGREATAANVAENVLTTKDVAGFRRRWSVSVGGMVTAQPLYVPAVTIGGKSVPVLLIASSDNTVTAIDPVRGTRLWRQSLGAPKPQVCGGTGGIESSPTVELAEGRVYVIGADGHLRALALATGKPIAGMNVQIIKRTDVETVWGALRLAAGRIYVPVASWCDKPDAQGPWDGRVVAVDAATGRISATFDVVPGADNGGGVWGPGGVSVDPGDGSIWTATANAVVYANGNLDEDAGLAERVVHLTPSLKVLGSVRQPDSNPSILGDQGFGATPMLFQPAGCPPLVAVNSKSLYTYVWRRNSLGAAPVLRMKFGASGAPNTFYAQPTWDAATRTLVVGGAELSNGGAGAVGLRLEKGCRFAVAWQADVGGGIQPQPLAVGGIVFVSATATHSLVALNGATGALIADLDTGTAAYTAPMMAGQLVVVVNAAGTVEAFGSAREMTAAG
jgi:outer membrane protein assembly factor BamB